MISSIFAPAEYLVRAMDVQFVPRHTQMKWPEPLDYPPANPIAFYELPAAAKVFPRRELYPTTYRAERAARAAPPASSQLPALELELEPGAPLPPDPLLALRRPGKAPHPRTVRHFAGFLGAATPIVDDEGLCSRERNRRRLLFDNYPLLERWFAPDPAACYDTVTGLLSHPHLLDAATLAALRPVDAAGRTDVRAEPLWKHELRALTDALQLHASDTRPGTPLLLLLLRSTLRLHIRV